MYQGGQAATLLYFIANQKELIIHISKRLPPFLTVRDKGMCEGGGGDALSSLSSVLRVKEDSSSQRSPPNPAVTNYLANTSSLMQRCVLSSFVRWPAAQCLSRRAIVFPMQSYSFALYKSQESLLLDDTCQVWETISCMQAMCSPGTQRNACHKEAGAQEVSCKMND